MKLRPCGQSAGDEVCSGKFPKEQLSEVSQLHSLLAVLVWREKEGYFKTAPSLAATPLLEFPGLGTPAAAAEVPWPRLRRCPRSPCVSAMFSLSLWPFNDQPTTKLNPTTGALIAPEGRPAWTHSELVHNDFWVTWEAATRTTLLGASL